MNAPLGKYFAFHSCCRSVSILYWGIEPADDGVFTTIQQFEYIPDDSGSSVHNCLFIYAKEFHKGEQNWRHSPKEHVFPKQRSVISSLI